MNKIDIEKYGYNDFYKKQTELLGEEVKELIPARVTEVHREQYEIVTSFGENTARLKGSIFYNGEDVIYPAIGDFVLVKKNDLGDDIIYKVLDRKSKFSRMDTFNEKEQMVAANFDYVFIMTSLNHDFNVKRIERYLAIAWQSGASPVIVLTKKDLCSDFTYYTDMLSSVAIGVPVILISSKTGEGLEELNEFIKPCKTIVFLGSSGIGKSSLVNAIAGEEIMKVNNIREDDSKGRHTTTHRELVMLKNGTMIIDTPGMRELGIWNAKEGLSTTYEDIEALIKDCRFNNCTHKSEPGCKIREALSDGTLSEERWNNYNKLLKEERFAEYKERKKNKKVNASSKNNGKKYSKDELSVSLDMVEEGYSFSEVSKESSLNKSIIAREIRKRKNEKAKCYK